MPTIAIIGAGPGLGRSLAFRFGSHGFDIALIARNREKLAVLRNELTAAGIRAELFPADAADPAALSAALTAAQATFGGIDVLEFSPYSGLVQVFPEQLTPQNLRPELEVTLIGAVTAVQSVLPGMMERGTGTILFTTGTGAIHPYPMLAATNAAQAGLRNWAHNLHNVLADKGVHVATVAIGVFIGKVAPEGVPHLDPDIIADSYWDLYVKRDRVDELVTSHPDGQ